MARRSLRIRRKLALLLLVLLALALLELNRFLPGGWPGGGGEGGSRRWPVSATDPYRVRPPEGEIPDMPSEGITVVMRTYGGRPLADTFVAIDREGATERRTDERGSVVIDDPRVFEAGLRIRQGASVVRHGPADPTGGGAWTVHLPATSVPEASPSRALELEVVAAEDGRPIASSVLRFGTASGRRETTTSTDGSVTVDGLDGRTLLHVEAEGRTPARRWVHPSEQSPVRIRLPRTPRLDVAFVEAATGRPASITMLRVLSRDGTVLWERSPALDGLPETIETDADLTDALLEIHSARAPVVRMPLSALGSEVHLPAGRVLEVRALDLRARPTGGARVQAHYVPEILGEGAPHMAEPLEVSVHESTHPRVPEGAAARLLVEAVGSAPRAVDVAPDAPGGRLDVRLAVGRRVDVRVVDAQGAPVEGARVVVLTSADGMRVTRTAITRGDGTVRVRDLPAGPVEVYARARGTAWSAKPATAAEDGAVVELRLVPGHVLRAVVESTLGLPIEGVRVHAASLDADAVDVVPPDAEPARTKADGTVVLRDLPDRPYRLRISHPGYHEVLVPSVRPGPGVHFVTMLPRD